MPNFSSIFKTAFVLWGVLVWVLCVWPSCQNRCWVPLLHLIRFQGAVSTSKHTLGGQRGCVRGWRRWKDLASTYEYAWDLEVLRGLRVMNARGLTEAIRGSPIDNLRLREPHLTSEHPVHSPTAVTPSPMVTFNSWSSGEDASENSSFTNGLFLISWFTLFSLWTTMPLLP